jgi:hypothetical protein
LIEQLKNIKEGYTIGFESAEMFTKMNKAIFEVYDIILAILFSCFGNSMSGDIFEQVLDLLEDKFHNVYTDKEKRSRFLKQVLNDWYNKKISKEGLLSVNTL